MNKKSKEAKREGKMLNAIRKKCIDKNKEKEVMTYFRSFVHVIVPCIIAPFSNIVKNVPIFCMFLCISTLFLTFLSFFSLFKLFPEKTELLPACPRI